MVVRGVKAGSMRLAPLDRRVKPLVSLARLWHNHENARQMEVSMPIALVYIIGSLAKALNLMYQHQDNLGPGFALMAVALISPTASFKIKNALMRKQGARRIISIVIGIALLGIAYYLGAQCQIQLLLLPPVNGQIWGAIGVFFGLLIGVSEPKEAQ
jgi:hypothetical protein